jgi:hypothetical protein
MLIVNVQNVVMQGPYTMCLSLWGHCVMMTTVILNVITQNLVTLMLNFLMLGVIILKVVAPKQHSNSR